MYMMLSVLAFIPKNGYVLAEKDTQKKVQKLWLGSFV
jgi:hypothetical protein